MWFLDVERKVVLSLVHEKGQEYYQSFSRLLRFEGFFCTLRCTFFSSC